MKEKISRREFLRMLKGATVQLFYVNWGLNLFELGSQPEQEVQLAQIIRKGPSDKPWIALTVDDCWSLGGVAKILEVCAKYKARVSFFPVGKMVDRDPELWKEIVVRGHEIGNHTYGHEYLDKEKVGEEGIFATIEKANDAIFRATGLFPRFFRPPGMYGFTKMNDYCNELRRMIFKSNLPFVALWSRDSYSGAIKLGREAGETDDKIVERIVSVGSSAKNGDIVLMHVNKWDLGAIERVIANLTDKGIRLVTLSKLCGILPRPSIQNMAGSRNEKFVME